MTKNIKRYNLSVPKRMMDEIVELCRQECIPILEFIRKCIRMGVFVHAAVKQGGRLSIVRKDGEKEYLEVV